MRLNRIGHEERTVASEMAWLTAPAEDTCASPDGQRIVFQREHGYGNMALFR